MFVPFKERVSDFLVSNWIAQYKHPPKMSSANLGIVINCLISEKVEISLIKLYVL